MREQAANNSVEFTVMGPPVPKARHRTYKGKAYTPKKTLGYEKLVAQHALRARTFAHLRPFDGPVGLKVVVSFADKRRRDLSNVLKSLEDGMNKIIYDDDSQICEIHAYVQHGQPHVKVSVWPINAETLT